MKPVWTSVAWIALAAGTAGVPVFAQMQDNTEKQMTCENGGNDGDRARHCEIREQSVPSAGMLSIDSGQNGGATVKGWLRSEVLVRSRVEVQGDTQAAAAAVASQVMIDSSGGQVHAMGPEPANNASWSVSYEIFVPQSTDLTVKAHNGGVTIADVRGQIHFDVNNGGVHLKRVAGDVSGSTVNGGIQVDLAGTIWDGRQLEVSTRNGGVTVGMPAAYSAHLQAETRSGSIQSDFPMTLASGNVRPRQLDSNIGAGGPLIHVSTENGGVHLKRTETQ
jgi:Putative adhesin